MGGRGAEGERRAGPRQCQRVAVGHAIGVAGGGERHCKRVLRARKSSCRVAAQQDNEENAPNVHEGCSIMLSCAQRVPHFFTRCAPLSLALALAHCAMHMQVRILGGVVACVAAAQAAAEERAGVLGGLRFTPSVLHQSHTSTQIMNANIPTAKVFAFCYHANRDLRDGRPRACCPSPPCPQNTPASRPPLSKLSFECSRWKWNGAPGSSAHSSHSTFRPAQAWASTA